jgi:hypothetical protein
LGDVMLPARAGEELERLHRSLLARYLDREPRSLRVIREMQAAPTRGRRVAGVSSSALAGGRPSSTVT